MMREYDAYILMIIILSYLLVTLHYFVQQNLLFYNQYKNENIEPQAALIYKSYESAANLHKKTKMIKPNIQCEFYLFFPTSRVYNINYWNHVITTLGMPHNMDNCSQSMTNIKYHSRPN